MYYLQLTAMVDRERWRTMEEKIDRNRNSRYRNGNRYRYRHRHRYRYRYRV